MNTTRSSILVAEIPGYAELQREMHDALRAQHPEWIEADGKSPTCDYYESLFAELLVSHRADARVHYDDLLNITETERHTANSNIPVGYAEALAVFVVDTEDNALTTPDHAGGSR
jgi:hypothetical protein